MEIFPKDSLSAPEGGRGGGKGKEMKKKNEDKRNRY